MEHIEFETPENVQVRYQLAGLGSRFIAWLLDSLLYGSLIVVLVIIVLIAMSASAKAWEDIRRMVLNLQPGQFPEAPLYIIGLGLCVFSFSVFLYYGLSEWLMRGQTVGKRAMGLRVVKANGFSLDGGAIAIRTIFRLIDHIPIVWIVPFVSQRAQRLGDMAASTLVIREGASRLSPLRARLLARPPADAVFRFTGAALLRARAEDIEAAEAVFERWRTLRVADRERLAAVLCDALSQRLAVPPPEPRQRQMFLEDFLAAYYQSQYRRLG